MTTSFMEKIYIREVSLIKKKQQARCFTKENKHKTSFERNKSTYKKFHEENINIRQFLGIKKIQQVSIRKKFNMQ